MNVDPVQVPIIPSSRGLRGRCGRCEPYECGGVPEAKPLRQ